MNIETELRAAMAEHVSDTTAPPDLVAGVRKKHRRRIVRNRALAGGSLAVAAVATVPFLVTGGPDGSGQEAAGRVEPGGKPSAFVGPGQQADPNQPDAWVPGNKPSGLCSPDTVPPDQQEPSDKHGGQQPLQQLQTTGLGGVKVDLPAQLQNAVPKSVPGTKGNGFWTYGVLYSNASTSVRVAVLCGPESAGERLLTTQTAWTASAKPTKIRGSAGRLAPGHAAWVERNGVGIDVQVSNDVDLNDVVNGITVTG